MDYAKQFADAGYEVAQTGGGCEAYALYGHGWHVLITDEGGCALPIEGDVIVVGVYSDVTGFEVETLMGAEYTTPAEALLAVDAFIQKLRA